MHAVRFDILREAILVTIVLFLLKEGTANAQVLQHRGAIDPLTEGFTRDPTGGANLGPVLNDFGADAWSIDINAGTQFGFYQAFLSPEQQFSLTNGWILSAVLRVAEVPDDGGGMLARFYVGTKMFPMYFGAQSDGDPFVRLGSSSQLPAPSYVLNDTGGGYHRYSLVYDPGTLSASLWVDGVEVVTGFRGYEIASSPRVDWGGGQAITHANWSEVTLAPLPEPTVITMLSIGVIAFAGRRHRRNDGAVIHDREV